MTNSHDKAAGDTTDTQRLDWLQKTQYSVESYYMTELHSIGYAIYSSRGGVVYATTLRGAIDAAMKAERGEK